MIKVKDHCKGCALLAKHTQKNLTQQQKKYDNWCCAKGAPAKNSIAYCITHKLKKVG